MKQFSQIPHKLIRSKALTSTEKMLLIYFSGFTPCYPNYDLIQEELSLARASVSKAIKSLVTKGMLSVKKGSKKSGKANEYRIHLDVIPTDPTPSKPEKTSNSISSKEELLTTLISSNGALTNPISSKEALINDGLKSNINDLEVLLVQNKHSNNTNIYNCTNTAKHKEENVITEISNTNTTVETSLLVQSPLAEEQIQNKSTYTATPPVPLPPPKLSIVDIVAILEDDYCLYLGKYAADTLERIKDIIDSTPVIELKPTLRDLCELIRSNPSANLRYLPEHHLRALYSAVS